MSGLCSFKAVDARFAWYMYLLGLSLIASVKWWKASL
jgi:hypothetical protein